MLVLWWLVVRGFSCRFFSPLVGGCVLSFIALDAVVSMDYPLYAMRQLHLSITKVAAGSRLVAALATVRKMRNTYIDVMYTIRCGSYE